MTRKLFALALVVSLGGLSGCSMCCAPFDYDYAAYGGVMPRGDMRHGRVGSKFQPADGYGYGEGVVYESMPAEGEWVEVPAGQ